MRRLAFAAAWVIVGMVLVVLLMILFSSIGRL
jgi:hypothetical protein